MAIAQPPCEGMHMDTPRTDSSSGAHVPPERRGAERRRRPRSPMSGELPRSALESLILGMYAEMPGLSLHLNQAARLFALQERTCAPVLEDLVRQGRLRRSPDGQYRV
jgi:hypothetical protein